MAKTKQEKEVLLEQYKELIANKPNYILVNTEKASANQLTELKKLLKNIDSVLVVVKNTLFKIAAQEKNQPDQMQELENATAVIFSGEDIAATAKALKEMQKNDEILETRFGVLFGEYADQGKVKQIADLPSREVLLSKLIGSMQAPISGFMNAITGNAKGFVRVLSEIKNTKSN
ncbi:50S ribosomal protein L10 [Candidatus Dojkabacteria bacterium]|nr:50S ribosomal protein L10 [Candidatus Dojkabacteria bacterium]